MKIKISTILIIIVLIGAASYFYYHNSKKDELHENEFHIHAGFKVYKDDQQVDFSGLEFMKVNPCLTGDHHEEIDEQIEKAHLHDSVGDVAHVHRENATWRDLFINMNYPITGNEELLNSPIKAYDSVIFFEGVNTDTENKLANKVSRERILEVEAKSEDCGS